MSDNGDVDGGSSSNGDNSFYPDSSDFPPTSPNFY